MSVKIQIPTALRPYTDQKDSVVLDGATVGEALDALTSRHKELGVHLLDDSGKLRNFVNVYLNDEDIRTLKGRNTELKDGDTLLIVPAIAGGAEEQP